MSQSAEKQSSNLYTWWSLLQCETHTSIWVFKWIIKLWPLRLLQVPGCPAARRHRSRSASQWPGVDPVTKNDAAWAAEREDLGGLLPPRAAVCLLPGPHHPLHLRQHPHLLVGVLSGVCCLSFSAQHLDLHSEHLQKFRVKTRGVATVVIYLGHSVSCCGGITDSSSQLKICLVCSVNMKWK